MAGLPSPDGIVVAVDGPSGSGKSSTAKAVARRLGLRYLDTGALYRAVTWWVLHEGLDPHDPQALVARIREPQLTVFTDPDVPHVEVDGHDVTEAIRAPEVTHAVSAVSAVPEVRERLLELQRDTIAAGGIVVEGRDIGTVVVPGATVKVYLVASSAARAARRAVDWAHHEVTVEETHAALERRDELDSTRELSPLTRADDAVEIDSTEQTLDEVVDEVLDLVRARAGGL